MKTKYIALREDGYDVTNGHESHTIVKTFRNEGDARAFVTDPKNIRMYGVMLLRKYYCDGAERVSEDVDCGTESRS